MRDRQSYPALAACQVTKYCQRGFLKSFRYPPSGCANCVWLDYAEEVVRYFDSKGMTSSLDELLDTVDKNLEDPMIKAFIKMELKFKYQFNKK